MSDRSKPLVWTAGRILDATGGELVCGPTRHVFTGVSIDSRTIGSDDLFVAIEGKTHDGHRFIPQVLGNGVRGLIVNRTALPGLKDVLNPDTLCIAVEDTTVALGAIGTHQRNETGVKLVAITGSNGKTSTRAMTESVLSERFSTLSTEGNFNNEIGLPLTLLRLSDGHEWAAVELGMNAPGEIDRLSKIALPDIGIITNVAEAHLEGLGSIENVAGAKAELLDYLPADKTAILNADDPMYPVLRSHCRCKVVTFGLSGMADVRADSVFLKDRNVHFTLIIDGKRLPVCLDTSGRFMVSNALAAAAAGWVAGLDPQEIANGLDAFHPVYGRMIVQESPKGIHVIDDTYNANPNSMRAAISTLADLKGRNRGVFVVGDMKELGPSTDDLHRDLGAFAARNGVDCIFSVGEKARLIAEEAVMNGMDKKSVFTGSKKEIIESLSKNLGKGDWVLVKGSRSMAMEEIVKDLLGSHGA
jgi:UDP-N-acetylmuramoyl-tripeptide--D-alanyl-D-alanine ligase